MSGNPDLLALFRREASTLFNLHHEAIVRYFVFSVDPALQRAYLAMEFVDGPSLAKRVAERPLSVEEARILIRRIGPALDAAHRLGVIHRDISSDNFILPDGDVRKAKLIDFGIARSQRPGEATIIGDGFAGKYNYVAPEQLGLYGGEVTAKSDIYSFGLVLAEALRGRPLDMSGTQAEIIDKRRKSPDLSDAPREFRPLLQSMLKPNPADRPASMAEVVAAMGPAASSGSGRRRRGSAAAWVALAIILASLGAVGYVFRDDIRDFIAQLWPAVAPTPDANAGSDAEFLRRRRRQAPTPTTETPTLTPTPSPSETGAATPTPSPTPTKGQILNDLLRELPPRAPQTLIALPPATVGRPYRAITPAFTDPGKMGLTLTAEGLPEGLRFVDRGDGSGELMGSPTRAGSTTFVIVARNANGRTARMSATLTVAEAAAASDATPTPTQVPRPTPVPTLTPTPRRRRRRRSPRPTASPTLAPTPKS